MTTDTYFWCKFELTLVMCCWGSDETVTAAIDRMFRKKFKADDIIEVRDSEGNWKKIVYRITCEKLAYITRENRGIRVQERFHTRYSMRYLSLMISDSNRDLPLYYHGICFPSVYLICYHVVALIVLFLAFAAGVTNNVVLVMQYTHVFGSFYICFYMSCINRSQTPTFSLLVDFVVAWMDIFD